MAINTKSKVSLTTFRPKDHGMAAYKDKPLMLGLIIGVVTGKSTKRNVSPSGEVGPDFIGMFGNFRCYLGASLEEAAKSDITQSGLCYLPDPWMMPMLQLLEDGAKTVEFAFKVSIGKRGEDGYEWILSPLHEPTGSDPLAALAATIIPNTQAIAGPEEPETAAANPTGKAGKAA